MKFGIMFKIASLVAVLVLGLLAISTILVLDRRTTANDMALLGKLGHLAPNISNVIHELQKERGMSAGYVGSQGQKFKSVIPGQRTLTDGMHKAFDEALETFPQDEFGSELSKRIQIANRALGNLPSTRSDITNLKINVPQMAGYYTGTIAKLLDIVEIMASYSTDTDITKKIVAYTAYLQGKERSGVERAMATGGFGAKKFSPKVYRRFLQLIAMQEVFLDRFDRLAAQKLIDFHTSTVRGPVVEELQRLRVIAINSPETGHTGDVDATHFYDIITKKINLLKIVEDEIAQDLTSSADSVQEEASNQFMIILGVVILLTVIGLGLAVFITLGITRPVKSLTATMGILASGETEVDVDHRERGDELGEMARAVEVFKENAIEKIRLEQEEENARGQREEQEQADRDREAADNAERLSRQDRVDTLTSDFGGTVEEILGVVSSQSTEMESTAMSMSDIAKQTMDESVAVSSAAEEASASVQTVAAAAEELSSSIMEISRQVSHSAEISNKAVAASNETNSTIRELAEAAQRIGEVVNLINDIAEQTNLLALNATIEAARAGDAGKGFAVVASEVKNLATQTARATEDIGGQISAIQGTTDHAVEAIEGISKTIGEMNEIATTIASAVEEQGAATSEISRNVQEAAKGTQSVTESIVTVRQATEQTGTASNEVLGSSRELAERFSTLQTEVQAFLENIKTA
jgi:methyl-accepting chemotaxis protein